MKHKTSKSYFHLKTPCFPEKRANQKSIHFAFLIVLLVLRDEPLLAPSVCNSLCCPHVSSHKYVILTEDFMLQGMFTTNCFSTDVCLSFHWYALRLATVEKETSSPHYFLPRWHYPLLRTHRIKSSQQTPPQGHCANHGGAFTGSAGGMYSCGIFWEIRCLKLVTPFKHSTQGLPTFFLGGTILPAQCWY